MIRLYNTLTRKVEEIHTMHKDKAHMFVCGPTVYDYSHLGHAKTYIQLDVLARTLRAAGYDTFYLQNITDIDDKIIARAAENNESWKALSQRFEKEYLQDMQALGNSSVTEYARATDYIADIIKQVQTLLDKGHAYKTNDGIYFEIATFPEYGKLSGRHEIQENDAQSRIDESDQKRGWNDFALWKFSKPNEPVWPAPFGDGRPGWHIEDTAITEHFFGPQYDIHGGAIDLIFPHHEAEITQMESASGLSPFVRYWVHTGFLNINDAKMSKSLKNFYTIREVLDKGYDPMAIRLFMLQSHYRSSVNFTWENLDSAVERLRGYKETAALQWQPSSTARTHTSDNFSQTITEIRRHLENDLNTPLALATLNGFGDVLKSTGISSSNLTDFRQFLKTIDDLLGLRLSEVTDITKKQKELIARRQKARDEKQWSESDALRDTLAEQGIEVRDTPSGPIWYRL